MEKPTTFSPHYPRLPAVTPTPARRPAFDPERLTKRPASEPDTNRNGGRNDGLNNGYDMTGLGDNCAGDRKGEEHGYRYGYEQGPLPALAVTSIALMLSIAVQPEDIGYFDPHLDEAYGKGDIVHIGKDVYYRDVHLFLGQAKSIAMAKGPYLIRIGLHICLRGDAQKWYAVNCQIYNGTAYTEASALKTGLKP